MRGVIVTLVGLAAVVAALYGGVRGCNMLWNNRRIETPARQTVSWATGLVGHIECTRYRDGSADIKVYPGLVGHRTLSSKLYQELDGDEKVDRIRINGPEWQYNRLIDILHREANESRKEFREGDNFLSVCQGKWSQ